MKVIYNKTNNTLEIIGITAAQASTFSLALKNPLAAAAVGNEFIQEFNTHKETQQGVEQNKKR